MQNPNKRFTQIVLMFSMVAILQCCCCIIPVRWRTRNFPTITSAPAITISDQTLARANGLSARSGLVVNSQGSMIPVCSIAAEPVTAWAWEWDQEPLLPAGR